MMHTINKFCLIPVKYENLKRGAFTASLRFYDDHFEHVDVIENREIKDENQLNILNEQYKKLIFITQAQTNYHFRLNVVTLKDLDYIIYTRIYRPWFGTNNCNNGFYYTHCREIENYIPLITDFKVKKIKQDIPCLGFYLRHWLTPDSSLYIKDLLKNIKEEVNVIFMGDAKFLETNDNVKSITHTFNNKKMFENITHYIYPKSTYQDPLPHNLIEAIQSGCQIICPDLKNRKHKDGIDDILEVTNYHKTFNAKILDNSSNILTSKNFKAFYDGVFANGFTHVLDRGKYKTFTKWIEGEVTW